MVSNMSAWGEPLGTPAKGDKWDTVLGNLWAWDQFGRQGGGVKLHILLIKKRKQWVIEIYRCLGLLREKGEDVSFWNGTCEVALGRTCLLCAPSVLLVTLTDSHFIPSTTWSKSVALCGILFTGRSILIFPTSPPTSSHCTFPVPHYRVVRLITGIDIYFMEGFPSIAYPISLGKGIRIWCGFPPLCT